MSIPSVLCATNRCFSKRRRQGRLSGLTVLNEVAKSFVLSTRSTSVTSSVAVSFTAVADAGDRDDVLVFESEEYSIVAAAEPEAGAWRIEFLHIDVAAGEVTIHAVQNLQRVSRSMARRSVRPFRRPNDRNTLRIAYCLRPNLRRIS
jgi:hypothetical protein